MIVKIIVSQIKLVIYYRDHNYYFMYLIFINSNIIIVTKGGLLLEK